MSDDTRVLLYSLTNKGYYRGDEASAPHYVSDPNFARAFTPAEAERQVGSPFPTDHFVIADPDGGWIQHDGGVCPVAGETLVQVRWSDGEVSQPAGARADEWLWTYVGKPHPHGGDITAWRPAQEERDAPPPCSVCGRPTGGCCTVADHSTEHSVTSPPLPSVVAGPGTPDAAGVGGVRERLAYVMKTELVNVENAIRSRVPEADVNPHSFVLALRKQLTAILAALPEGELIDAGEKEADFFSEVLEDGTEVEHTDYCFVIANARVPAPGLYRVFVQRKGGGVMRDVFRPSHEPARMLYDAFQAEAASRPGRSYEKWVSAERTAVWKAARDYAQQNGLPVPTLKAVADAEEQALGHTDFGAKWAYRVADLLRPTERSGSE